MSAAIQLLRRRPDFRRLWLGNMVSQLGDWIGWVAVAVLALHGGGGPMDVAVVFVAHHLPAAALTPVSGALADRFDRRRVLIVVSLLLSVTTLLMVAAAMASMIGLLQGLLVVRSAMTAFFSPAERAALPRVVHRDEILVASAVDAGTWSVVFSLGMALGGLLTALGPALALAIDALTFVAAAMLFARLPPIPPESSNSGARVDKPSMWGELLTALRYMGPRAELRQAILAKGPLALAGGAAWLALAMKSEALAGAAVGFGLLNAIRGVGTGIGPALVAWRLSRNGMRARLWTGAYVAGLLGMLGFAAADSLGTALLAVVAWGVGSGANWVLSGERIAVLVPDRLQARLNAVDQISMILGQTLGVVLLAAWLTGGGSAATGVGLLAAVAAVAWALLAWPRRLREPSATEAVRV
ncbi:MAG: MFS transporter [Nannocystaceae bacterium]|nr:MFS transporter [Nannocystaceae bacterium]